MLRTSALWGLGPLFRAGTEPSEVDVISGACLMMRRSVFDQLRGFSTDYFMYSEDVDLCFRARQAGFHNYYVPSAEVIHHGGGSTTKGGASNFSSVMMLESRWRFFLKTQSLLYGWMYRIGMLTMSLVRLCVAAVLLPLTWLTTERERWVGTWHKWNSRFRWALGLESWVRDY
jgi:GT2 family glycosyltransferase